MNKIKNSRTEIRFPLIIAISVIVGIFIGASALEPKQSFTNVSNSIGKFRDVILSIDKNYVDEISTSELVDNAIVEMLDKLDPHSNYIPTDEVERLNAQLHGMYEGIGIQFDILRDTVYVIKALEGGPSKALGLQSGDKIISVEDETIAGIGINSVGVTDRLLGPAGSEVSISVLRKMEILEFTIKRGQIPQRSVEASYMIDDEIGYIKITRFGSKTHEEFKRGLELLIEEGMSKLILDLQSNPGGLMSAAENISDELIAGKRLIVSQKSAHDKYNSSYYAKKDGIFEEGPVIVLIDEYSASASEIVSGALQDHDRALIVGRRTFGKGLVQMPITLKDNSELRLTIARYFTPSGRSIQKPYNNGDNYHLDLSARYDQGEFFHADSIKFQDSLQYETAKGRVIYGGGGIMPDHFVPLDTTAQTTYYRKLVGNRAVREFSLNYYLSEKEVLEAMDFGTFQDQFEIDNDMLHDVVRIGEELDVVFNQEEYDISLPLLKGFIKSEIAALIWDEVGYYSIFNPVSNESYNKALELMDEAALMAEAFYIN